MLQHGSQDCRGNITALSHDGRGSGSGFAWLSLRGLTVFSCYCRPGASLPEYQLFLGDLEAAIRAREDSSIVLVAWNVEWGSRTNNLRGATLSDLATNLGLTLANLGTSPTFVRGGTTSIIDLTFYRGVDLIGWQVPDLETLSDHNYVCFNTADLAQAPVCADIPANISPGWSTKKLDPDALCRHLSTTHLGATVDAACAETALSSAESLDVFLFGACEASMSRKRNGPEGSRPVFWWSDKIADLRRQSLALRRRYQACIRRVSQPGVQDARFSYIAAKRKLLIAIREAKNKCWADLCAQVDTDPWADPISL
ncbi:uncharacterized protein LOC111028418 [Myzus persicae]|uniref:uncharacterized protein LOC111028418 n=1 Tax=Myzus persicae TaxID=13164 RepID=UPI000B93867A|nr:uncharacterized protein LOC111028418 [Myzus persicae]